MHRNGYFAPAEVNAEEARAQAALARIEKEDLALHV
jgi:hypothetical protein